MPETLLFSHVLLELVTAIPQEAGGKGIPKRAAIQRNTNRGAMTKRTFP